MDAFLPQALPKWHSTPLKGLIIGIILLIITIYRLTRSPRRLQKIPHTVERVLILGATSGIGRSLAVQYARRSAQVYVVGRRSDQVQEVCCECRELQMKVLSVTFEELKARKNILGLAGDFSDPKSMVAVRDYLKSEWGGLDTLIVTAGVSALQPLLEVAAGSEGVSVTDVSEGMRSGTRKRIPETPLHGIENAARVSSLAVQGNYTGPLVSAVTFIPLLTNTSKSPSILLLNSVASLIPAPTRSLYASTKAASLVLYQALSIEHPNIAFTCFMPSTVEGDFRASAVDQGPVRESNPNKHGLKREDVARRCIQSIDNGYKVVFMPGYMRYGHFLYWIWPRLVQQFAKIKYNFK